MHEAAFWENFKIIFVYKSIKHFEPLKIITPPPPPQFELVKKNGQLVQGL